MTKHDRALLRRPPGAPLSATLFAALALSGCADFADEPGELPAPVAATDTATDEAAAPPTNLEVVDRVFDGTTVRYYLAERLAPAAVRDVLAVAEWFAPGDHGIDRGAIDATVSVGDDGFSLELTLAEAPPADATVHGILLPNGSDKPIELGHVDAPGEYTSALELATTQVQGVGPIIIGLPQREPLRITSTTVGLGGRTNVARSLRTLNVWFNKPLDCRATPQNVFAFRLYTAEPSSNYQQYMYDDTRHPDASDRFYRGTLDCNSQAKRLTFTLPGPLLGDAVVKLLVRDVVSTDGQKLAPATIDFRTARPGIRARLTKMFHNYSRCDKKRTLKKNEYKERCDVYMAVASYGADRDVPAEGFKVPTSGSYGNWKKDDARTMNASVYESYSPVPPLIGLDFVLMDHDDDSAAKKAQKIINTITGVVANLLNAFGQSAYAAIATGVSQISDAIIEAVADGTDDFLGHLHLALDRSDARWGTQRDASVPFRAYRNNGNWMNLFIRFEEWPGSWKL